jgi:hypothetical protein
MERTIWPLYQVREKTICNYSKSTFIVSNLTVYFLFELTFMDPPLLPLGLYVPEWRYFSMLYSNHLLNTENFIAQISITRTALTVWRCLTLVVPYYENFAEACSLNQLLNE